jgi:hypothetical protein
MPVWGWYIVSSVLALLLLAGAYFGGRAAYRRIARRYLIGIVGHREGILASQRTLEAILRHLADEDDEQLEYFAAHPDDADRKALVEVTRRMEIAREELDTMPLLRSLQAPATALADAAHIIAAEAGRVGESTDSEAVFSALAEVDVARAAEASVAADAMVNEVSERFDLDEAAVYGGGLYI